MIMTIFAILTVIYLGIGLIYTLYIAREEGPCALEEAKMSACPDCTDLYMSYGEGGYYRTKWLFGFFPWGKEWVRCETCGGRGEIYD